MTRNTSRGENDCSPFNASRTISWCTRYYDMLSERHLRCLTWWFVKKKYTNDILYMIIARTETHSKSLRSYRNCCAYPRGKSVLNRLQNREVYTTLTAIGKTVSAVNAVRWANAPSRSSGYITLLFRVYTGYLPPKTFCWSLRLAYVWYIIMVCFEHSLEIITKLIHPIVTSTMFLFDFISTVSLHIAYILLTVRQSHYLRTDWIRVKRSNSSNASDSGRSDKKYYKSDYKRSERLGD